MKASNVRLIVYHYIQKFHQVSMLWFLFRLKSQAKHIRLKDLPRRNVYSKLKYCYHSGTSDRHVGILVTFTKVGT